MYLYTVYVAKKIKKKFSQIYEQYILPTYTPTELATSNKFTSNAKKENLENICRVINSAYSKNG
jgi:hypothetical protein